MAMPNPEFNDSSEPLPSRNFHADYASQDEIDVIAGFMAEAENFSKIERMVLGQSEIKYWAAKIGWLALNALSYLSVSNLVLVQEPPQSIQSKRKS